MQPYLISTDAESRPWKRTTLRELKRNEAFLEQVVASNPEVLGLDPYETGISRSVEVFRQATPQTPTGRDITPNIVLLTESGHVVIVEAKLADNPELKGRQVVAQVVEYAASVANLGDEELLAWLDAEPGESWRGFVRRTFPKVQDSDRLAAAIRRRMRDAELHLVIVCDGAPEGLREFVAAVAGQAALGEFRLHVVELTPYTVEGVQDVLLVPTSKVETEIVARTAITVNSVDLKQRVVSVNATSPEETAD